LRKRRWALIAFILMIASVFIGVESWKLLKANEKLKTVIIYELKPILGSQLHISRVHVGFGNIHLHNVRVPVPGQNMHVQIKDLRIGYNFLNLLVRGFSPQYISQDALFIEPKIYIQAAERNSVAADTSTTLLSGRDSHELANGAIPLFNFFQYISLIRGSIFYDINDSTHVVLAHSLQGGISRRAGDSLYVTLSGAFFQSKENNIYIEGHSSGAISEFSLIDLSLQNYSLTQGLPFPSPKWLNMTTGSISANFQITFDEGEQRHVFDGGGEILDAGGDILNGQFTLEKMDCQFSVERNRLIIHSAQQLINQSPVSITGAIHSFSDPIFDLEIHSESLAVAHFAHLAGKTLADKMRGLCTLQAHIEGPLDTLTTHGRLFSPHLEMNTTSLENFDALFKYESGILTVPKWSVNIWDHQFMGESIIDLNPSRKTLAAQVRGNASLSPRKWFGLGIDSSLVVKSEMNISVSGPMNQLSTRGDCRLIFPSFAQDSLIYNYSFDLLGKKLDVNSVRTTELPYVTMNLDWAQKPTHLSLHAEQSEKLAPILWPDSPLNQRLKAFSCTIQVSGAIQELIAETTIRKPAEDAIDNQVCFALFSLKRNDKGFQADGQFTLYPSSDLAMRGEVKLEKTKQLIHIKRFDIENQLTSSASIDLDDQEVKGTLECVKLDLGRISGKQDSLVSGSLDAAFKWGGKLTSPQLYGSLSVDHFLYQGLGPYQLVMDCDYDSNRFELGRFLINKGQTTLLYAKGQFDAETDKLDFTVKGAGFDASSIYRVAGKDTVITGESLVNLTVQGRLAAPEFRGVVAVKNGRLFRVPFDQMELHLGSKDSPASEPAKLNIDSFRLVRQGEFEILASGYYPLSPQDSLFLNIDGSGNFLKILNDFVKFFVEPSSFCSFTGRLRGTPLNPQVAAAHLTIRDANMKFASVVPEISQVNGEVTFSPIDQFLQVVNLEGKMGGKPFRIHSESPNKIVSKKPIESLTLADFGLNVGVLVLETSEEGVPLNFIGLMEPNKFGNLELIGREPGEKFYFAGLPDGFTLRGTVNLHDADIMYPFYESGKRPGSKILEFLENLTWDIDVIPAKNNSFVRSFPGAIDQVYVNLKIDEQFGHLDFSGRIADESFRINGLVRSTKGIIQYLDMNFRVERVGIEFDRGSLIPVAYGQARTTVTDSLGISSNVILSLQTVDNTMDKKEVDDIVRQEEGRARFDRIRFKLSCDNPAIGNNEAQIMASLGYSGNDIKNSAIQAIGYSTDNLIFRPLFRPVERELENTFGLDYVRFSSQLTKNIIYFNLNNNIDLNNRLALLESTRLILGKYLSNRLFLQYTGQIESGVGYRYKEKELGFRHTLGLEYQINPQVLVELEYDYDSLMLYNRNDKRILVRHWFPF